MDEQNKSENSVVEQNEGVNQENVQNQSNVKTEEQAKATQEGKKGSFKKFLPLIIIGAVILVAVIIFLAVRGSSGKTYVNKVGDLNLELDGALAFSEGLAPALKDEKWGYIDKQGRIVIDYQFEGAMPFSEGLAIVQKDGNMGFIDKQGNEVIACEYDNIGEEGFQNGVARVYKDGDWGVIDKTGKIVVEFGKYYKINEFKDGVASVESELSRDWTRESGYIDSKGNEVVALSLDNLGLEYPSEGLAVKSNAKYNTTSSLERLYGYVNSNQEMVIEQKYKKAGEFSEGLAPVSEDGENIGFIDKNGNLVIGYQFKNTTGFKDGYAIVINENNKCGVIDKKGNLVVDYQYEYIAPFSEGMAVVVTDMDAEENNCGYINTKGEMVIEPIYDAKNIILYGYADFSEGLAMVVNGDYCGYINYDGKPIIGKIAE